MLSYRRVPDWELTLMVTELLSMPQTKKVRRQLRRINKEQNRRRNALLSEWAV
ncbi:hypothetical protein U27_02620 [Candidatus Vecturithrix granuli]|uniref:Uncharacterized protein n=1 Tax=Vecturithrix granuli TaxID=1499967 RepID=A0A081CB32_VECG1|nr:hypothetical protein U27_02620 [Candidatus Vecturithrix granuli]